ncbi:MAG: M42 family metallopeptidase [Halobacteriales archaeon]
MDPSEFEFDYDLLCALTEADGVPGHEDAVRDLVRRELDGAVDTVETDAMGNVVGTRNPDAEFSVVVGAHMDEIGFMVRHVTEEGFLQVDALGGWDPRILRAQRVRVHTDDGPLPGVIGSPPPHTLDEEEREGQPEVEDVYIDVGLEGDAVEERVDRGDPVTMRASTEVLGEHVAGKALDDRVCLFAMLAAARRIDPEVRVHFAATVQEEVGLRGARALGVDLDPDLAIALDVTVANDIPGFEAADHVTELGEGVAIKLKDSSVITSPKVMDRLRGVAGEEGIPHQTEILPRGGTDTAGFQRSGGAVPAGALSVPTRYLHTPTESAHHGDVAATIDLLAAFLEAETGGDYTL